MTNPETEQNRTIQIDVNGIVEYDIHLGIRGRDEKITYSIKRKDGCIVADISIDEWVAKYGEDDLAAVMYKLHDREAFGYILPDVKCLAELLEFTEEKTNELIAYTWGRIRAGQDDAIKEMVDKRGYYGYVVRSETLPAAYTIGLRHMGLPDICIGCNVTAEVASSVFETLIEKWRTEGYTEGRIANVLEGYDIYVPPLRAANLPWHEELLGIPKFYNQHPDYDKLDKTKYPVVAQVYLPDINNRFPHEEGYDGTMTQPEICTAVA